MRTRILVGCAVVASAGLGAFAASGFGERSGELSVHAVTVEAHEAEGAPPAAAAPARRASLFKVIYKSTKPTDIGAGYSSVKVRSCPKGSAVLSAWFVRTGADRTGMVASGSVPDGTRKWIVVVNNTTGADQPVRFGIVCLKG